MSVSTRNTPSSAPAAACAPFSGLGHTMKTIAAVAGSLCPHWEVAPASMQPASPPAKAYGYALQCRLGRETRAG